MAGLDIRQLMIRNIPYKGGITKKEEGMLMHFRFVQDTVKNLQFRNAFTGLMLNPAVTGNIIFLENTGDVTISFSQNADKQRLALIK
jgi:hypothetical protein